MYAYQIEPPTPEARFSRIKTLLGKAQTVARAAARMWTGRVVMETRVTHILVVSDSPSRQRVVNRALEGELKLLGVRFLVNEPVALPSAKARRSRRAKAVIAPPTPATRR